MMAIPCFGPCGRDCNADQGRRRCDACPGRPFALPRQLKPLSLKAIGVGMAVLLALLWAQTCAVGACS